MEDDNEDVESYNFSERHSQIMRDMEKFFARLVYIVIGVIVVVCGFFVFFIFGGCRE